MDIRGLIEAMIQSPGFNRVINNPLAQFGTADRKYLGAELLPEQTKPENAYTEEGIKYRTVVANDGTRYSPVQKKGGVLVGSFDVRLSNSDIGSEFTGADYDALIRIIEQTQGSAGVAGGGVNRPEMMAMANLTQWSDATLVRPLKEKNELMRWQCLVAASVARTGDNGYVETVTYPNPTGHRVSAGGTWTNNSYDPWADIIAGAEFLAAKGYTVSRIITGQSVVTKMANNTQVKLRAGRVSVSASVVSGIPGRATLEDLNNLLEQDSLPPIETYNLQYRTQTGSGYFLPRDVLMLVATTGRDQMIDRADVEPVILQNTLGYTGIGRPAGQASPGAKVVLTPFSNKPPRIEGEAWQTSLPVQTDPEAVFVISGIA
jgi:hypothetical protein